MAENNENNTSIIPIGSTGIVRVNNSIEITKKIIKEYEERSVFDFFKTIKIGKQEWMTKNLDVDLYTNGDPIPQIKNQDEWENTKSGAWCYINNNPLNEIKYGKLYNYYAISDERGLAPKGYKIPKDEDWVALFKELKLINGDDIKDFTDYSASRIIDKSMNFLSGGYRHNCFIGPEGNTTFFGTSSEIDFNNGSILLSFAGSYRLESAPKYTGAYLRCLKI